MDVLCIADIHGDREALMGLVKAAEDKSLKHVLILGDFPPHSAFRDTARGLNEVRFVLDALANFDVLAIPGNCDSLETLGVFDEYGVNLHEKAVTLEGTTFVGFGGSATTPFGTPFEMSEEVIYEKLEKLLSGVSGERLVVAAHNPPLGTNCDVRSSGDHVGSSAMRSIIEKFQPDVFACSHIHESGGSSDTIRETCVVNVGPLSRHRICVLRIGKKIDVKLGVF
jgi:hypothetical protein